MKQDSFIYPLKLTLGFLAVVVIALLFSGCGSLVRVEYQNPKYGGGAVEFALPKKEGYAK
jgi:uncharacterized protein YceK